MNRSFRIAALITFINALSATVLIPVIYLYARAFELTDLQAGLLLSTFSAAQFFATPIMGKLSDRFGRKPLLVISLMGTVIANFLASSASFLPLSIGCVVLFSARFFDGMTGGNVSVAQAIVADVTEPKDRAKAYGIFGAAFGMGFVVGPVISLVAQKLTEGMGTKISLGAAFFASSILATIALTLTLLFLPETLPPEKRKVGGRWFDLGLKELAQGFFLPRIGILILLNFLIGTTFTIFTFGFQPYYTKVLDQGNLSLTGLFVMIGVLGASSQLGGVPWLSKRTTLTKILFAGLLVRGFTFLVMPIWPDIRYFIGVGIVFALFNAMVQPMISTLVSLNVTPERQGIASGLNSSYLSIANAVGPVIAGLMVNEKFPISYSYPLYFAGVATLGTLGLAIVTRDRYKPDGIEI
ncbi:MAG: MFS transporter [Alkalinema sp. CAN_BIN05]|nr:MFS transporter [Alkalinema sp. CAN_BIN05]